MFDAKVTLCVSEVVSMVATILRLAIPDALTVLRRLWLGAVGLTCVFPDYTGSPRTSGQ